MDPTCVTSKIDHGSRRQTSTFLEIDARCAGVQSNASKRFRDCRESYKTAKWVESLAQGLERDMMTRHGFLHLESTRLFDEPATFYHLVDGRLPTEIGKSAHRVASLNADSAILELHDDFDSNGWWLSTKFFVCACCPRCGTGLGYLFVVTHPAKGLYTVLSSDAMLNHDS